MTRTRPIPQRQDYCRCYQCQRRRRVSSGVAMGVAGAILLFAALMIGKAIRNYACDPEWPVYQCDGTAETNHQRCCK